MRKLKIKTTFVTHTLKWENEKEKQHLLHRLHHSESCSFSSRSVISYDFKLHFSSFIGHLDAFRVQLGCIALHLSLLSDGDAIWWIWNLWRWFRDKNGDFGS